MAADVPGTYVLEIELPAPADMVVGALGRVRFDAGRYAYVGSAMNGLRRRIARHLRADKTVHWHIDYLLREATVARVWHAPGERRECEVARVLAARFAAVDKFGCSDCRCSSHLFGVDGEALSRLLVHHGLSVSSPERWR